MKRHLERLRTAGAKPWPAPFRALERADGTVALATVFSGALGFRIGGISLMPLRLVLADAAMVEGGSTEIAMMMTAPSATHGFRKWAPEIATRFPAPWPHCAATETQYPRSAPDEHLERAGRVGKLLAAGRRAPSLMVEVLRPRAEPLLALIWAVEKKVSYMVLS
jgi:hypothetical protein